MQRLRLGTKKRAFHIHMQKTLSSLSIATMKPHA
nr:MAG TPA: hypothetical protein [Caudoviricetes sp.]